MKCSDIIRFLREEKGLKQAEVAKIINTTQQQYSKYEKGYAEVSVKALVALANYYKVSTDYLLGRINYSGNFNEFEKFISTTPAAAQLLSDFKTLNPESQNSVLEYAKLQMLKEKSELMGKGNGR